MFITQRITRVVYEAIKEKAWLCEATEIDKEERLVKEVKRIIESKKVKGNSERKRGQID